jgi:hypothetical protein
MPEIGTSGLTRAGEARKLAPPLLYPSFTKIARRDLKSFQSMVFRTSVHHSPLRDSSGCGGSGWTQLRLQDHDTGIFHCFLDAPPRRLCLGEACETATF